MISDQFRKVEQFSPKQNNVTSMGVANTLVPAGSIISNVNNSNNVSGPGSGGRSPGVSIRPDSSGTLKTTISLGKNPSIVHSGPFYLMKEPPGNMEISAFVNFLINLIYFIENEDLTGATNLMAHYGLEHAYSKFIGKKVKEQLSAFLPNLPGLVDNPGNIVIHSLKLLYTYFLLIQIFNRIIVPYVELLKNRQYWERN